jgi:hypothetical protein
MADSENIQVLKKYLAKEDFALALVDAYCQQNDGENGAIAEVIANRLAEVRKELGDGASQGS